MINKNSIFRSVCSWLIVAWVCKVFLFSLPYKFTEHPDTMHIFSTIGEWLEGFLGVITGQYFAKYGAIIIGIAELITATILLLPVVLWIVNKLGVKIQYQRSIFHSWGGMMASTIMLGAVFFHLCSPLGIEVLHQGQSDHGSLFYAALSILILGIVLFLINGRKLSNPFS